jgi:hypothetical protein
MQVTAILIVLALSHDTDRIVSIYVTTPKVAKASTIQVAVTGIITGVIALTFANGNTALLGKTQNKLECLYLVRIFRLVQYLTLRARAYP